MKKYDVSIIVPVYNVEDYIDKCLSSLVNQTLENIEIIVVNDGSPDNSQKIIDKYVKKYPKKVKCYVKENGGQGSARNFGLTKAKGEYIEYCDSDDYVEEDMFEKMYQKAIRNKLDIVICGSYNVYENGKRDIELNREIFKDKKKNSFFGRMAVWNKIYKRELLVDSNISFRSKLWYEDLDFTLQVLTSAKKVGYINKPFYNYLIREGSTMNNSKVDRNLEILLAFDEVLKISDFDQSILEFLMIDHIYISAVVRVINADVNNKKRLVIINKLISYVESKCPNYNKNEYLNVLPRNRKIVYNLVRAKCYWLVRLIFRIKRVINL